MDSTKRKDASASILDVTSLQSKNLGDIVQESDKFTSNTTIVLVADDLQKQKCQRCFSEIGFSTDRLSYIKSCARTQGFYEAKMIMDEKKVSEFTLVTGKSAFSEWEAICSSLLTPVYNYSLESVDDGKASECVSLSIVEKDVSNFLGTLPGKGNIQILKSNIIPEDVFLHGFSARTGGLSTTSGMASLNLVFSKAKRDSNLLVKENRKKLATAAGFNADRFYVASAVHGADVYVLGEPEPNTGYDAIITNEAKATVAAPGADCVTMLFADPVARACGALHSGWKGTVKRACVEVLKEMKSKFGCRAEDILVALGPSIGHCCFEFGADQTEQFRSIEPECVVWRPNEEKPFINLKLAIRVLLEQNGVKSEHIDDTSATKCTSCNPELFFSYRRDGRPFGNQVGFISLR